MKQTNYKDAVLKIKKIITDVYQQYIELAGWEGLTEVQVRQFQSVDPYMDDVTAQCALIFKSSNDDWDYQSFQRIYFFGSE